MARKSIDDELSPEELQNIEQVQGIAECLGMAFFETIRCAVYQGINPSPEGTKADRQRRETANLREVWRNLADKIIEFAMED